MDLVHRLAILEASPAAIGHVHLRLERPAGFTARPGQYVMGQLPGDENPRPLAIASLESSPHVELLVRTPDEVRDDLIERVRGGEAKLSAPGGPGWKTDDLDGRAVWGICVGSGISALRSLVDARREDPTLNGLIYGVRDEDHLCFVDDLARWRKSGVVVETPFSSRGARVQHLLDLVPNDAVCFLVGMREMVEETKAALAGRGFEPDDLRLNF